MSDDYRVITCLACGKRNLAEGTSVYKLKLFKSLYENGCECGKNEFILTDCGSHDKAKKLEAMPLKEQFKLMYQALQSKREVVKLVTEMIDTLTAVVNKAELADDLEPLKEVVKWLKQMVVSEVNQLNGDQNNQE
jgi:phage host-nuclease inhibitor protein Gam